MGGEMMGGKWKGVDSRGERGREWSEEGRQGNLQFKQETPAQGDCFMKMYGCMKFALVGLTQVGCFMPFTMREKE